jgi:hypothetical protein
MENKNPRQGIAICDTAGESFSVSVFSRNISLNEVIKGTIPIASMIGVTSEQLASGVLLKTRDEKDWGGIGVFDVIMVHLKNSVPQSPFKIIRNVIFTEKNYPKIIFSDLS